MSSGSGRNGSGSVVLVGAGPGDAGLLTDSAKQWLARADVVLYDRLVSPQVLSHIRADAALVYVGKDSTHHAASQPEIHRLLIEHAQAGRQVVRLKGGDPLVFGRGGEEAAALREAGIRFTIIPGISSAIGALTYAGIPVTHRHVATSFTVVTGHECVSDDASLVDWSRMVDPHGTLIILMGVSHLAEITAQLLAHGRAPQTPAAVVRWGTRAGQQTVTGTLSDIAGIATSARLTAPCIIVVGEVVQYRATLTWYELQPLFGQRILAVTELAEDAQTMAATLADGGAEVVGFALSCFAKPDLQQLDVLLEAMLVAPAAGQSAWLFSRRLDVHMWAHRLRERRLDVRRLAGVAIGAADEAVATSLEAAGVIPDWIGALPVGRQGQGVAPLFRIVGADTRLRAIVDAWEECPWRTVTDAEWVRRWVTDHVHQATGDNTTTARPNEVVAL